MNTSLVYQFEAEVIAKNLGFIAEFKNSYAVLRLNKSYFELEENCENKQAFMTQAYSRTEASTHSYYLHFPVNKLPTHCFIQDK